MALKSPPACEPPDIRDQSFCSKDPNLTTSQPGASLLTYGQFQRKTKPSSSNSSMATQPTAQRAGADQRQAKCKHGGRELFDGQRIVGNREWA